MAPLARQGLMERCVNAASQLLRQTANMISITTKTSFNDIDMSVALLSMHSCFVTGGGKTLCRRQASWVRSSQQGLQGV
eukprot:1578190-Amphidinium_carterae.2